jgi:hypothetical protein
VSRVGCGMAAGVSAGSRRPGSAVRQRSRLHAQLQRAHARPGSQLCLGSAADQSSQAVAGRPA